MGEKEVLLENELKRRVHFAEVRYSKQTFARRLVEKIKPVAGRSSQEIGEAGIDLLETVRKCPGFEGVSASRGATQFKPED